MKCTNCGAEIGNNAKCEYCGTVMQQEAQAPQQGVPVPPPYPTQQPYNGQQAAPQAQNPAPQQPFGAPPQAPQPPYPYSAPQQPYGVPQPPYAAPAPMVVDPNMQKSKMAAGLLGIFLGSFGVHNFYLGYTGKAVAQLLITVLTCGFGSFVSGIWGLVEGIMILSGNINVDGKNIPLKD